MGKYRSRSSYLSSDAEKRKNSLANLRKGWGKHKFKKSKVKFLPSFAHPETYRDDIIGFAEDQVILPESGELIVLDEWQKEKVFKPVFYGEDRPSLFLMSTPKKHGKSMVGAIAALHRLYCGEQPEDEIYLASNDFDQSKAILYRKCIQTIERNPFMMSQTEMSEKEIKNRVNGSRIVPLPRDFRGAAGLAGGLIIYDELGLFDLEDQERLFTELQLSPIRENPLIMVVSTVGYAERGIFYDLFTEAQKNQPGSEDYDPDFYSFIVQNENIASWVTPKYLSSQKRKLKSRPGQHERLHLNLYQALAEGLVTQEIYQKNLDHSLVPGPARQAPVFIGIDASTKHDSTAMCAIERVGDTYTLIDHQIVTPEKGEKLKLESVVQRKVEDWNERYLIESVGYDPLQMSVIADSLEEQGIPMREVAQAVKIMSQGVNALFSLLRAGKMRMYPDEEIRQHLLSAEIEEKRDGSWKLVKDNRKHKIDFSICLAIAIYVAMKGEQDEGGEMEVCPGSGWQSAYGG